MSALAKLSQDLAQPTRLSRWLGTITRDYADAILPFGEEIAQIWGRLHVPPAENQMDKSVYVNDRARV